eukprot:Hpha_TRINITY_DN15460_c2_g3::TRINITY_DN15460_c2_g3_i1::g.176460::m.176460
MRPFPFTSNLACSLHNPPLAPFPGLTPCPSVPRVKDSQCAVDYYSVPFNFVPPPHSVLPLPQRPRWLGDPTRPPSPLTVTPCPESWSGDGGGKNSSTEELKGTDCLVF